VRSKIIVITGASDGIGAAAARQLKLNGHQPFLVGRSPEKTEAIASEIDAPYAVADFSRLSEVYSLADDILARCPTIDVLVNNAGLMAPKHREVTEDGHELTHQVNYLSAFLLDHLLLDRLRASHATVIATSSMAHWIGRPNPGVPRRNYSNWTAYGTSKIDLMLHTQELQRRHGADLTAVCFHPGVVSTNFSAGSGSLINLVYGSPARRILPVTPEKGADTMVYLAEATPGTDFTPADYLIRRRPARTRACVRDPLLAHTLWRQSEQELGIRHD